MLFNSIFTIFWDFNIQCRVCYTACSVNRRETVSQWTVFKFPIKSIMIPLELNWPVSFITIYIYILYVIITLTSLYLFEQCLRLCVSRTSSVFLPLQYESLDVFPNCKSLWINASAKWLNVNVIRVWLWCYNQKLLSMYFYILCITLHISDSPCAQLRAWYDDYFLCDDIQ